MYVQLVTYKSASEAIAAYQELHKLPFDTSKGTSSGNSYWSTFESCPRKWQLRYKEAQVGSEKDHLSIGSLVHLALALWHLALPLDWEFFDRFGCNPTVVAEAQRLVRAYVDNYLTPFGETLAVEHEVVWDGYSCRYDRVCKVEDRFYIVDYKTASRFDSATLDSWDLNGEIIGQQRLWRRAGLDKTFGPLEGTMIDIIGKQVVPKFERVFVYPNEQLWAEQEHNLVQLRLRKEQCERNKHYPQHFSSCVNRYGFCDFYSVCRQ